MGERDGSCYFSMKFVEGGQLDEVVKRDADVDPTGGGINREGSCAPCITRMSTAFCIETSSRGTFCVDAKGEPLLTDFGLARLVETESTVTRTMDVLGTPSYMAPEQAVGNNAAVSSATDVYGLGAVLYQLLTGHPPFAGGTTYETIKLLLGYRTAATAPVESENRSRPLHNLSQVSRRKIQSAVTLPLSRWRKTWNTG